VSQLSPRLIALVALAAVVAGVGLISKGTFKNSSSSGSGDPAAQQIIDRGLNNSNLHSGRFSATLDTKLQGGNVPPQLANALSTTASGIFNDRGAGNSGELDATMRVSLGRNIEVRVVSTGKEAFVRFGGRTYRVTAADLARTGKVGRPQDALGLATLGIQPHSWIENARYQGTATIDGVTTDHVSGDLNVDRILDDFETLSSKYPRPSGPVSSSEVDQMKDAIKGGNFEIYASKRDGTIRKARLSFEMEAKDGSGTFDFGFDVSDVNKPQRINPLPGGLPFSQLERDLSSGTLNPLAATASAEPSPAPQAGAATAAIPPEAQGYLGCVQKATSQAELAGCSGLLP
jgi:hypothetical protein